MPAIQVKTGESVLARGRRKPVPRVVVPVVLESESEEDSEGQSEGESEADESGEEEDEDLEEAVVVGGVERVELGGYEVGMAC